MNNMNQRQLLRYIDAVSLALDDVTLFLDTHPTDTDAMEYYNMYKEKRAQAVRDYSRSFGPLNRYNVTCSNEWQWNQGPWPWQGEV